MMSKVVSVVSATLISFLGTKAVAYEEDIHYFTTFAVASAIGWSAEEARVIASANQGVDENKATVAALEVDVAASRLSGGYYIASPVHQAEQNLRLHCFSSTSENPQQISGDVRSSSDLLVGRASAAAERPSASDSRLKSLIALGLALHCIQDSYSHHGYGGSCGKYPGNCVGHALDSAFDELRRVSRRSRIEPDHPVTNAWALKQALTDTTTTLSSFYRLINPGREPNGISAKEMDALVGALRRHDWEPAENRIECNRFVIGKWLDGALIVRKQNYQRGRSPLDTTCPVSDLNVAFIPDGLFPRMNSAGDPTFVPPNRYVLTTSAGDRSLTYLKHTQVTKSGEADSEYSFTVRVSDKSQIAGAALFLALIVVPQNAKPFGISVPIGTSTSAEIKAKFRAPQLKNYAVSAELKPAKDVEWTDADLSNDKLICAVEEKSTPATTHSSELGSSWSTECARPALTHQGPRPSAPTDVH